MQYPAAKLYLLPIRKGWKIPSRHPESFCLCSHSLSVMAPFPTEPKTSLGILLSFTSIQGSSYQLILISMEDMKPTSCFISLQYRLPLLSPFWNCLFSYAIFVLFLNKMFIPSYFLNLYLYTTTAKSLWAVTCHFFPFEL